MIQQANLAALAKLGEELATFLLPDLTKIVRVRFRPDSILLESLQETPGIALGEELLTGRVGGGTLADTVGLGGGACAGAFPLPVPPD